MKHAHSNSTSILKYAAIALAAVFVVSVTLLFVGLWEKQRSEFPEEQQTPKTLSYNGVEYVLKDNIETFLIMGLDKFEGDVVGEDELRADFLMLLVFDNAEKKYSAVHINRDTMTSVNRLDVSGNKINSVTEQIALAHTRGYSEKVNCRNTSDAVSELLLGVKINHYLSMKMDAVPKLNDLVGGVEVTVLDDFTGVDDTLVKGETVTLMGEHALNYVRTRYGLEDSTNSTRMIRQKQYINALREKTMSLIASDEEFIVTATVEMSESIVSDRSVTQLQELCRKMSEYEYTDILTIEGHSIVGEKYMEFYPDIDSLKKIVVDLFYKPKD